MDQTTVVDHLEEGHHHKEVGAEAGLGTVGAVAEDRSEVDKLVGHN